MDGWSGCRLGLVLSVFKVVRDWQAMVAPEARCSHCQWECPPARDARKAGKAHVQATGHTVVVDVVSRTCYKPKEKRDA